MVMRIVIHSNDLHSLNRLLLTKIIAINNGKFENGKSLGFIVKLNRPAIQTMYVC